VRIGHPKLALLLRTSLLAIFAWANSFATPSLSLPVDGDPAIGYTIQNYFDHDPSPGFEDYRCGRLGYDTHDGTDFRIASLQVMRQGIRVIAAADGVVRATRNRMLDISVREAGRASVEGVEAGNAVVIRHDDDWETQYSHLKSGSVLVQPGDKVRRGDPLGQIGLSGNTEFPHLHFEVRYRGEPVDPFVGLTRDTTCGPGAAPLWTAEVMRMLEYKPSGLLQAGFLSQPPADDRFANGLPKTDELSSFAPALVFAVEIYGAHKGDFIWMRILDPNGETVALKETQVPGNKARWASYLGRRRPKHGWSPGTYVGLFELRRQGSLGAEAAMEIERRVRIISSK
jgi:murein DD-endopeptidase MepM/ murein hydrolase activator NlpD